MIQIFLLFLFAFGAQTNMVENCEQNNGNWDDVHLTCDNLDVEQCIEMNGKYLECKTPEFICPLDDPNCGYYLACHSSCIFENSLASNSIQLKEIKTEESLASIYSKNGDALRVLKLNQEVDVIFNFEFNDNNTSDGFAYYNIKENDKLITQSQNFTTFEIPKTFKFSYTPENIGNFSYTRGTVSDTDAFHNGKTQTITVIEHYSKAMQESNGNCKSPFPEFKLVIKPDFSTGACVTMDTAKILKERGWS